MGWGNIAVAAISVVGSYLGSRAKSKAADKAAGGQAGLQGNISNMQNQLYKIQKPVLKAKRDAALGAYSLLTQDINRKAGTGAPFQQALSTGSRNIMAGLAPYGLTDSSTSGRAIGELNASLLASDQKRLANDRFMLAGLGPNVLNTATGLFGQLGQTTNNIGNAELAKAGYKSDLYGDLAQTGAGLFQAYMNSRDTGGGGNTDGGSSWLDPDTGKNWNYG